MTAPRPRQYECLGILMTFHAFPDEAEGKYCLTECIVPPGLGAPPNHHAGETETFVVVEGRVDFMVDGQPVSAGAGESVRIPDGAVHAFAAAGETPARVLIANAPGDMHAGFFTDLGTPVTDGRTRPAPVDGPPDIGHVVATAKKWGMTILAPADAPAP